MGIPSVKREVHSYLTDTLNSLISELNQQEKEDTVIVVLIAEVKIILSPLNPPQIALHPFIVCLTGTWCRSSRLCVVLKQQDVSPHGYGPMPPLAQGDKSNLKLLSDKDHQAHPASGAQRAVSNVKRHLDALSCGESIR